MNYKGSFSPPKKGLKRTFVRLLRKDCAVNIKVQIQEGKLKEKEEQVILGNCWTLKATCFTKMITLTLGSRTPESTSAVNSTAGRENSAHLLSLRTDLHMGVVVDLSPGGSC